MQFDKRTCRAREHLIAAGKQFPDAWRWADSFRADRGRDGLPDWPEWCYLPLAGWYAVVSGGGSNRLGIDQVGEVARLAALGAWRVTQSVYRFDPALFEALVATPVDGDLPHDVLLRMPEWCVYIETPGLTWQEKPLYGFFAHLEVDANTRQGELRLLLDEIEALVPVVLHLGPWSLAESIERMGAVARGNALAAGVSMPAVEAGQALREAVTPLVSLLLYLCSQNSEIGNGDKAPGFPQPKRTKKGWRLFPPDQPTHWDVGVRLGSALRRAYHAAEVGQEGAHAGPRPHIRRAHWHGFREGPMKREDGSAIPTKERAFNLKWLPPIPVNLDTLADLPTTIRPVKS